MKERKHFTEHFRPDFTGPERLSDAFTRIGFTPAQVIAKMRVVVFLVTEGPDARSWANVSPVIGEALKTELAELEAAA